MGQNRHMAEPGVRVVTDVDVHDALALCARDQVGSVLASARIEALAATGATRGGPALWGYAPNGTLEAICWSGPNLVPVVAPGDTGALDAFAAHALREGRRCSSIVGPAEAVLGLWDRLRPVWGPAREIRSEQPSMVIDHPPWVEPDPDVRLTRPAELDVLLPACVQMFIEEVGYSPLTPDPRAYEARVRSLIRAGRSFVHLESGLEGPSVVFKAELGAVSRDVAQVQGVWVAPRLRRRGLASRGMAAVVAHTLEHVAPIVSLYVNDFNIKALATYEKVGFRQVGSYATVLF